MHLAEWGNGQRVFEEAGLQNSNDTNSLDTYSQILTDVGRGRDVIEIEERARALDPLSGVTSFTLAHLYAEDGRLDEAMQEFERGYLLGEYQIIFSGLGLATALATQDHDLIRLWLDRAMKHPGSAEAEEAHTAMAELLDDREAAIRWLRDTPVTNSHPFWAAYYGDDELALSSMHGSSADWTLWTPNASGVRKLPGFKDLVRERGMVDYWREYGWGYYCRPVGDDDFECE
jgi:tetratricopeptide (TPR) repeat protein